MTTAKDYLESALKCLVKAKVAVDKINCDGLASEASGHVDDVEHEIRAALAEISHVA